MALAETAQLVARLSLKDDFSRPLGGVNKSLATFKGNLGKVGKAAVVGIGAGVGVAAAVIGRSVRAGIDSLAELENATTSVDGAIEQLGLTGKISSQQIAGWANEIEAATQAAFDDKAITQAATTLLRYGKVGPEALKETLTVMTDLAAKTGSVDSAADKLAKALAAPTKASRLLRDVGVTLTKAQEEQIKKWVESGDLAKAQALILGEVAEATRGAAAAMNGPMVDSQRIFADVVEDAQRALATGFLPVLMEVREILSEELAKPGTLDNIKEFGEGLAGGLRGLIQTARGLPWDAIGGALKTGAAGAKAILDAFLGLPPWLQTAVLTSWGLNKLTGGAVFKIGVELVSSAVSSVFDKFFARGSSVANPLYVQDVLGGKGPLPPGGPNAGGAIASLLGTVGLIAGFAAIAESASKVPDAFANFTAGIDALSNKDVPAARDALADLVAGMPQFNPLVSSTGLIQVALEKWPTTPIKVENDQSMTDPGQRLGLTREDVNDAFNRGAVAAALTGSVDTFSAIRDNIETSRIGVTTELGLTRGAIITALATPPPMSPDERDEFRQLGAKTDQSRDATEASRIALSTKLGETRTAVDLGKAATDRARDSIEASRIALSTKLDTAKASIDLGKAATDRARDAIESSRISMATELGSTRGAIVGGGHSDAERIVTAIRNKDFSVKVTVNSSGSPDDRDKPKVKVETGGNVTRATDPRANGSGGLGGT